MSDKPPIGSVWRDRKGGIYIVTGHCRIDATYMDSVLMVGIGVGGSTTWVCTLDEFAGDRFTHVDLRSEFSTAREEGRLEGLEEASTRLDAAQKRHADRFKEDFRVQHGFAADVLQHEASAIRALKEKQP